MTTRHKWSPAGFRGCQKKKEKKVAASPQLSTSGLSLTAGQALRALLARCTDSKHKEQPCADKTHGGTRGGQHPNTYTVCTTAKHTPKHSVCVYVRARGSFDSSF